jgi:hypothetical protein
MSIIPALEKLRQEDLEFKANLCYIVRPCIINTCKRLESITCLGLSIVTDVFRSHLLQQVL